ncbi:WD repeat and HMG-box DNA binding-domain containing protein 1 [Tritrichomonas musculus]|uniref:WD repeat and HMG-box DNA binding-domain containing protein 1 n=1 Tax=Tritrichomonas musculus TaxID=1915356 RepID=A0ABR2L979_9EUKA
MSAPNKLTINGAHFGPVKKISLAPDNNHLLSLGSNDGIINVINFENFDISSDFNTASITDDQIFTFSSNENKKSFIITDDGNQILNVNWPDISQTSKIFETEAPMTFLAINTNGNLIAVSGDDPQVTIINLENPEDQTSLFDNTKAVTYIGFGPVCQTLVTINEDGEILTYSAANSYQDVKEQKVKVKTISAGVCWSIDSQLLISDSDSKGVFHVFHFPSEGYATGKIQNLGIISALSISKSFLLAACDTSQKIVISQYSENFIQDKKLPILHIFDPKIQTIATLYWVDNYLIAGDSEGSIHKWDKIEITNAKEIEVVKSVMESDQELEDLEDQDEVEIISKTRHLILSGRHKPEPPKSHQKQNRTDSSDEEDTEDYDEEEESNFKKSRNPYILDEASEASTDYESDTGSTNRRKNTNIPDFRPKLSAEDVAERIKKNLNIKNVEYSTTPTETEDETDGDPDRPLTKEEIRDLKEENKREAKLDREFIVHSGSEVSAESESSEEEDEDLIESVSESEEDLNKINENEFIQFMPGSTDIFENKRRFLCFNLIAKIFLRENADESTSIDIEYSDRSKYRSVHFDNKEHYILGTVTETGVTLASRSRVYYRPHNSWSTDCECQIKMENDEIIDLIASGNDWFAVATNLKRLRIFMGSGLEIAIIGIPQRPMTMTGSDDLLVIVFGDQFNDDLTFWLLDVKKRRQLKSGILPISKIVNWMGFDERTFYILGNNHVLYALANDFGYQFIPICNVQPKEEDNSEFWGVGVSKGNFWGVFLEEKRKYPEPITNLPLDGLDLEPQCADDESSDFILKRIAYCNSSKINKETTAMKMDMELLKQFSEAAKNRLFEKMLQIGLQITSQKGQKITLDYIKQKDEDFVEIAEKLEEYWAINNHVEEEDNNEKDDKQTIEKEEVQVVEQEEVQVIEHETDKENESENEQENTIETEQVKDSSENDQEFETKNELSDKEEQIENNEVNSENEVVENEREEIINSEDKSDNADSIDEDEAADSVEENDDSIEE